MFTRGRYRSLKGQSAVELAVFGAIVLFVLGLILKTALQSSQRANMDLRAHRMALRESYLTSLGQYSQMFSAGRNTSALLVMEDRLSIDPTKKQDTSDRVPYVAQGGATMSINLFMEVDENNMDDLPVYDVIINGQRFPFMTSRLMTNVNIRSAINPPLCMTNDYGEAMGLNVGVCWDATLAPPKYVFFRKAYNGEEGAWCTALVPSGNCGGWSAGSRFDLDFDGTSDFDVATARALGSAGPWLRDEFGWQWVKLTEDDLGKDLMVDIDGDWKEEKIISCEGSGFGLSCTYLDYQEGDFDTTSDEGSKKYYETVIGGKYEAPGIRQNVRAYSFTKDGTMLRNEEGKLYTATIGSTSQFVRSETRRDHIDIIERILYISNDTGRFCRDANNYRIWTSSYAQPRGLLNMGPNPVEACGNCFSMDIATGEDRRKLTCMDTSIPAIFVRSRIRDRRRKRWVTATHDGI